LEMRFCNVRSLIVNPHIRSADMNFSYSGY
jgi:hypothetical protein